MTARVAMPCLLALVATAQEPAWIHIDPTIGAYRNCIDRLGDFDGDGYVDLALAYQPDRAQPASWLRILSGFDGSTIWPAPGVPEISAVWVHGAGDVDGDGQPEVALVYGDFTAKFVDVWAPARNQLLWTAGPFSPAFVNTRLSHRFCGGVDVDGDGRSEMIGISSTLSESDVYVINSNGTLRYTIPVRASGWIAESVGAMPDLDGDGGDDFVVGAHQPGGIGGAFAISGRTGQILHFSSGLLPNDVLSGAVCDAGDVDGDGVHDYAASTQVFAFTNRTAIFSGATGALIRAYDYRAGDDSMIGNLDADLDGVPDLIVGNGGYPVTPTLLGEARCFSGRDGSVLWAIGSRNQNDQVKPSMMVDLGPQAGSPYPVVAWLHTDFQVQGRIVALHTNLLGAGPVGGNAASSTSLVPLIGMRTAPGGVQMHAAHGPPGALAWLLLAGADQTSVGGVSVPLPLFAFGLPGLVLFVPPFLTTTAIAGTAGFDTGFATATLPIPGLDPVGIPFAAQWLLLDPASGAFATTARHDFRFR